MSKMKDADNERPYDLEERTAKFGEAIIDFARKVPEAKELHLIFAKIFRGWLLHSSLEISHSFVIGYFVIRHS